MRVEPNTLRIILGPFMLVDLFVLTALLVGFVMVHMFFARAWKNLSTLAWPMWKGQMDHAVLHLGC